MRPGGRPRKRGICNTGGPCEVFVAFLSAIGTPEGLKPDVLKRLYTMLLILAKKSSSSSYVCSESATICFLSDVLFCHLETRFDKLLSLLVGADASHGPILHGTDASHLDIGRMVNELTLLLRCCLVLFMWPKFDQNLMVEKGRILHNIFSTLVSVELRTKNVRKYLTFKKFVWHESGVDEDFVASRSLIEISGASCSYLLPVLEVFVNELWMDKTLRGYFVLIDLASSTNEKLLVRHSAHDNFETVLEMISVHFILSVFVHKTSKTCLNRLCWCCGRDVAIPEISLQAALSLLFNPIMGSAPKIFQSYLISLVSETIGHHPPSDFVMPDTRHVDWHLRALKISTMLYTKHCSSLCVQLLHLGGDCSLRNPCFRGSCFCPSFESFLRPTTWDKLCHLNSELCKSWKPSPNGVSVRSISELVAASVLFVKENLYLFDESYRDNIMSILNCLITHGSSAAVTSTVIHEMEETNPEDIYLLISILTLMSNSMLQALWYIRHLKLSCSRRSFGDISLLKDYMAGFGCCFDQFNMHNLPMPKFFCEAMESTQTNHKMSKQLLLHFSCLLSWGYAHGLDCFVKNCLFIAMSIVNMFNFEGGDPSELGSLINECYSTMFSKKIERVSIVQEAVGTLKIQKISEMYMRTRFLISVECSGAPMLVDYSDKVQCAVETCRGGAFLQCIVGEHAKRLPDFNDLADYIECKPGRDYSYWLNQRKRFRGWIQKKRDTERWYRKQRTWNVLRSKRVVSTRQKGNRMPQKAKRGL